MEREGRQIEYKALIKDYSALSKTAVAFANDIGGTIYIGIKDGSLGVIGLEEEEIERYLEDIPKALFDTVSPHCIPQVTTELIDGKRVVRVHVFPGERKPYFIKSEGTPKGVYLRVGAHTRRVTPELYEDLLRQGNRTYWDEEQTSLSLEHADTTLIRLFYETTPDQTMLLADKVFCFDPFGGATSLTAGGVVYFHKKPSDVFPQCQTLYSEFDGDDISHPAKTVDIEGPLPSQVATILQLLRPHISEREEIDHDAHRQVVEWKIPEIALREVILNSLIHRNYALPSTVKVALFANRIEVFSPGNFPGPIDLSNLGNGISYSRNPRIQQLARKAGLVEKRGLGFRIMLDECERNGNLPPTVVEGPDYVKVTLYFSRETTPGLPQGFEKLEPYFRTRTPLQTREAKEILQTSINTARNRLVALVKLGLLELRGEGRGATYYWTDRKR